MTDADRTRWNQRYHTPRPDRAARSLLLECDALGCLPSRGAALDVACGEGYEALFLASKGLSVDAFDIASVALERLAERAPPNVHTKEVDFSELPGLDTTLASSHYDLILCFHYLNRALCPHLIRALAPGGILVTEIHGEANLERHASPSRRFLVRDEELESLYPELEPLLNTAAWHNGRFLCRFVGRKR